MARRLELVGQCGGGGLGIEAAGDDEIEGAFFGFLRVDLGVALRFSQALGEVVGVAAYAKGAKLNAIIDGPGAGQPRRLALLWGWILVAG